MDGFSLLFLSFIKGGHWTRRSATFFIALDGQRITSCGIIPLSVTCFDLMIDLTLKVYFLERSEYALVRLF